MNEDFTDFIEVSGLLNYDPDTISKISSLDFKSASSKILNMCLIAKFFSY